MKKRILIGLACGVFGIFVLIILQTAVIPFLLALICLVACYEILKAAKVTNKLIFGLSLAVAGLMPLLVNYNLIGRSGLPLSAWLMGYCLLLLLCVLPSFETTRFEHAAISLYASLFFPFAISSLLYLRGVHLAYPAYFQPAHGLFFVLTAITSSELSDAAAYIIGSKFGRRKLSPRISPKKSVEGAVGALVIVVLINSAIFLVCDRWYFFPDKHYIKLWMVIAATILLSALSVAGDLSASVIKRNYGIKDFGSLIPENGGVMDRLDSLSFVAPAMWIIVTCAMRLR